MARVSYVPYDPTYATLFEFCGITLEPTDFGGVKGWDAALFGAAAVKAQDYLNDNWNDEWTDEEAATYEQYYDMLAAYPVAYWSTEGSIIN